MAFPTASGSLTSSGGSVGAATSARSGSVTFDVTYNCANDPLKGAGHEDFRYFATVHHEAIDGQTDTHTADDNCPRAALPGGTDPNPDGKIKDTGCAGGVDVKTDVFIK